MTEAWALHTVQREMKVFTVEQANRTLPLVGRIVEDIVRTYARWQGKVREHELMSATLRPGDDRDLVRVEREAQGLAADLDAFRAELAALGVEFKGYDLGLVDFPCEMGGRIVYLCWRLGEPSVQYWHEVDAGFTGRRPLSTRAA